MFLITGLLTSIFQRKQEARNPYVRLVEVSEDTTDPAPWGVNWSREYDDYLRTVDITSTRFGGSEAIPDEKAGHPMVDAHVCRLCLCDRLPRRAAAMPTCFTTRKRPGASPSVRSPARACNATRR